MINHLEDSNPITLYPQPFLSKVHGSLCRNPGVQPDVQRVWSGPRGQRTHEMGDSFCTGIPFYGPTIQVCEIWSFAIYGTWRSNAIHWVGWFTFHLKASFPEQTDKLWVYQRSTNKPIVLGKTSRPIQVQPQFWVINLDQPRRSHAAMRNPCGP